MKALPAKSVLTPEDLAQAIATSQLVTQMSDIRYVREPQPGLSVARNAGIRHSRGEIIAFTDDDVVAHPNWIARLQQSFHHPKVMAVTGLVLPAGLETEAQLIFEKNLWGFNRGYSPLIFDTQFFNVTWII